MENSVLIETMTEAQLLPVMLALRAHNQDDTVMQHERTHIHAETILFEQTETSSMNSYLTTIILLSLSNIFMTFAWYGHLRNLSGSTWVIAALASWGIALFEYLLQVPANRIGHEVMNVGQLKILQECIALSVFIPFSIFYLKEKPNMDYVWAGLCILGAAFFLFRKKIFGA